MKTLEEIADKTVGKFLDDIEYKSNNEMRSRSFVEVVSEVYKEHMSVAIKAEQQRAKGLVEALEWYSFNTDGIPHEALKRTWIREMALSDGGKRARQALAKYNAHKALPLYEGDPA